MVRTDNGNLSPWLEGLNETITSLSARDTGFRSFPGWHRRFARSLQENPDAARLLQDVLPKCHMPKLAAFLTFLVDSRVEDQLLELKAKPGEGLKKLVRAAARKNKPVRKSAKKLLARANRAFDTRRQGLAQYCFGTLIVRRYLHFRSSIEPTARELAALLKAGLAASGKPPQQQIIDYDLLRRNLKNYEKRHPHKLASGERCASIVEAP